MKKMILVAVATLMTTVNALGQVEYPKNEISVTYGALSNSKVLNFYEDILSAPINAAGKVERKDGSFLGPISVEYFHHFNNWFAVGGIFAYGYEKADLLIDNTKKGDLKNSYYTLMPSVKFDWLRSKNFGMYSKLALGATLRKENNTYYNHDDSNVHLNWQASLLGMEAGSMNVRGFVELGMGEQGVLLAGLRYKF